MIDTCIWQKFCFIFVDVYTCIYQLTRFVYNLNQLGSLVVRLQWPYQEHESTSRLSFISLVDQVATSLRQYMDSVDSQKRKSNVSHVPPLTSNHVHSSELKLNISTSKNQLNIFTAEQQIIHAQTVKNTKRKIHHFWAKYAFPAILRRCYDVIRTISKYFCFKFWPFISSSWM